MNIIEQKLKEAQEDYMRICSNEVNFLEWIEKALKEVRDDTREEIFNSKKGDKVYIPKTDKTEQIWQCVSINHI